MAGGAPTLGRGHGELIVYDDRDLSVIARFGHEWFEEADLVVFSRGNECFVDLVSEQAAEHVAGVLVRLEGSVIRIVSELGSVEGAFVECWLDEHRLVASEGDSLVLLDARAGSVVGSVELPGGMAAATPLSETMVLAWGPRDLFMADVARSRAALIDFDGGLPEGAIRALHRLDARRIVTLWSGEAREEVLRVDELLTI